MFLNFEKWHGARNDFIVTWISATDGDVVLDSLRRVAPRLCDRWGSGIAADGILVLQTSKKSDLTPHKLTIINSDGSTAKNCGNGLRCAALSVLRHHRLSRDAGNPTEIPEAVELEVEGTTKVCRFAHGSGKSTWPHVTVEMGVARVNADCSWFESARGEVERVAKELNLPELSKDFGVCEIGNPHLVFFLDEASREKIRRIGPAFQKSRHWDGINVHIAHVEEVADKDKSSAKNTIGHKLTDLYRAWVWERGAGETQACGSGACAIVTCAYASGTTSRSDWVAVDMPGGRLYVHQGDEDAEVELAGPGEFVFEGVLEI